MRHGFYPSSRCVTFLLAINLSGSLIGNANATVFNCTFRSDSTVTNTCSIDTNAVQPCAYTFAPNLIASCTIVQSTSQSICGFTAPNGVNAGGQTQTPGASFGAQYKTPATPDYTVFCQ